MTPEQKQQRIEQIRERMGRYKLEPYAPDLWWDDTNFLLSLVKEQKESIELLTQIQAVANDALNMTLGQIQESAATAMHSACVEKVRRKARQSETTGFHITDREAKAKLHIEANVLYEAAKELESLSIEQPK